MAITSIACHCKTVCRIYTRASKLSRTLSTGLYKQGLTRRLLEAPSSRQACHLRGFCRHYQSSAVLASSATAEAAQDMKEVHFFPEAYPQVKAEASADYLAEEADLLAFILTSDLINSPDNDESSPSLREELQAVDSKMNSLLSALVSSGSFKGDQDSSVSTPWINGSAKRVCLVGIGAVEGLADKAECSVAFKNAGKQVAAVAKSTGSKVARIVLVGLPEEAQALEALASGVLLGGYEATRFKAKAKASKLATAVVHTKLEGADQALQSGIAFAKGTLLARYLVEAPPNICTPTHIATAAQKVQEGAPDVFSLEVLEKQQCQDMNMGLYLGVSECSDEPPKFIHLTYRSPGDGPKKVIGLIGKGLTFDSGGYNLKVGGMIEMMKFDMGGAGAVLGAAHTLGMLKPPGLEIHIITASCENMISGRGMRPGDILTAANGKTVEINNTDAEGRLTLGDALWFAQEKCKVEKVVDIATLTGACMVALGTDVAGLFSPSSSFREQLEAASHTTGEFLWSLPMHKQYWAQLKSPIADMKNSGGRMAGATTAALFLEQYVDTDKVEWAHIDIAGPAWDEKQGQATGFGAALLAKWVMDETMNKS